MRMENTLLRNVNFSGIGLHSGAPVNMNMQAAEPGSGKNLIVEKIAWEIIKSFEKEKNSRMIIYDNDLNFFPRLPISEVVLPKNDSNVVGFAPPQDQNYILISTEDARTYSWDIAKDIQTKEDAILVAKKLVPNVLNEDLFWTESIRSIFVSTQLDKIVSQSILALFGSFMNQDKSSDNNERRIWLVLNDFLSLGKMEEFGKYLESGRSNGITVVWGLENVSSMRKIYGEETADVWTAFWSRDICMGREMFRC